MSQNRGPRSSFDLAINRRRRDAIAQVRPSDGAASGRGCRRRARQLRLWRMQSPKVTRYPPNSERQLKSMTFFAIFLPPIWPHPKNQFFLDIMTCCSYYRRAPQKHWSLAIIWNDPEFWPNYVTISEKWQIWASILFSNIKNKETLKKKTYSIF